jgi:hypothetical protein
MVWGRFHPIPHNEAFKVKLRTGFATGAVLGLCLLIAWLYVGCPYLNNDDILWATGYFDRMNALPIGQRVLVLLFNLDVGQSELRTYGLSRLLQYGETVAFGRSPLALYSVIAALHAASAASLYWALRSVIRDDVTRVLIAVIWFTCPYIFGLSHTLHHHLYTVGPIYFLFVWLGVALNKPDWPWPIGAALLTCAWLMGESGIPAVFLVVAFVGIAKRSRSIALQGVVAFALFCVYVGYQRWFVALPGGRFRGVFPVSVDDALWRFSEFRRTIDFAFRFGLGLRTKDAVTGDWYIEALNVNHLVFYGALVAAGCATFALALSPRARLQERSWWIIVPVVCAIAGSLCLYVGFYVALGYPAFTHHYAPPVFALATTATPFFFYGKTARYVAGSVATLCIAFTLSMLQAMKTEVYAPHVANRDRLIAELHSGKDILLFPHAIKELKPATAIWPTIGTVHDYPAPNPLNALWLTDYYARYILGFKFVGSEYAEKDGKIVVSYGPSSMVVDDTSRILVIVADRPYKAHQNVSWYDWFDFQRTVHP